MLPARKFLLIGVVFGAATEVFSGPVMSSWAHRKDGMPTNESRTRERMRYLNRHNTRLEGFEGLAEQTSISELYERRDSLPNIAPDPLPQQLKWVGFQSKQLDVNGEKPTDLERTLFDWNFNRL
ncbi:hypothetical protein AAVH_26815 [Aphelenchoides avenae]|nr:hypothetical protein AAVH_26815 [Aphelenchus avenae]